MDSRDAHGWGYGIGLLGLLVGARVVAQWGAAALAPITRSAHSGRAPAARVGWKAFRAVPEGCSLDPIKATGRIVRSDVAGTAIQFSKPLEQGTFEAITRGPGILARIPLLKAYADYFRVSRSPNYQNSETLLGVNRQTFRTVFLTSFFTCIFAAILPVWLLRHSLIDLPIWSRIVGSFAYGADWLGAIQPTVDILAFRLLRHRARA